MENKNEELPTTNSLNESAPSQQDLAIDDTKVNHKKRNIILKVILIVVSAFFIIPFLFFVFDTGSLDIVCGGADRALERATEKADNIADGVIIDGKRPDVRRTEKNGDCLTGSGAYTKLTFNVKDQNLTLSEASKKVLTSLNPAVIPGTQEFINGLAGSTGEISRLETVASDKNGNTYTAYFTLLKTIECIDEHGSSTVCTFEKCADYSINEDKPRIIPCRVNYFDKYDVLNKQVGTITIKYEVSK